MFNISFFINSILLGVGLAMDAFSVSMANGLAEPDMKRSRMHLIAGTFGFFQAFMPMFGWFCVHNIMSYFRTFETFVPWIALVLLLFIGDKMLLESILNIRRGMRTGEKARPEKVTLLTLFLQGIATSIDALSVGFAIADYDWFTALVCALIIAAVTFIIAATGLHIGRLFGLKLSSKAGILGGCILIIIGIEIFIH